MASKVKTTSSSSQSTTSQETFPGSVEPAAALTKTESTGQPWSASFAVIGDFGNVTSKKNNLYQEKIPSNYVGEAIRQMGPDFVVSLGDDSYVEGKRTWKDFNVGKNYAPYLSPYTVLNANAKNPGALAIGSASYLASQVPHKSWNRFFTAPGNHEVGMSGGKGTMEASGRRDWSHDKYYKAAYENAAKTGALEPIAGSYVKPGDILYHDYSYGTPFLHPGTWFKQKEGAMADAYYDYIVHPTNKDGAVLKDLANIYMVDRNNAAYTTKNSAYKKWKDLNPNALMDPQASSLMAEAQKRDQDVAWQIFGSHYQTYSSGGSQAGMQLPFFKNGVDLVLGAHEHNYERIKSADSSGVTGDYIVNGSGGYNTSYSGFDNLDSVFVPVGKVAGYKAGSTNKWGFGWIDMNKSELRYTQYDVEFTRKKNRWPVGVAVEAYSGLQDLAKVRITKVDQLILRKGVDDHVATADPVSAALKIPAAFGSTPNLQSIVPPNLVA